MEKQVWASVMAHYQTQHQKQFRIKKNAIKN